MAALSLRGWWRHVRLRAHETVFIRVSQLARAAALIGAGNSARALVYAIRRARIDARSLPRVRTPAPNGPRRRPATVHAAVPVPGGARIDFGEDVLEVGFLADGGVFLGWGHDGEVATPLPSYALATETAPARASDVALEAPEPARHIVRHGELAVEIDDSGSTFWSGDTVVRTDPHPEWIGDGWEQRSQLPRDAAVHGLGGRSTVVDHRPGRYRLWNTDPGGTYARGDDPLSLTMPVYQVIGDEGCHLAFYDNAFDGEVLIDANTVTMRLSAGPLRYYVFFGTPAEVLEQYTGLTGRPALPPRWGLGYHQSRWGYNSEAAMRTVVDEFRTQELPISAIWMDIDHLVEHRVFDVDRRRYPDLSGFAGDLAADDIHLVAIVDPAIPPVRGFEVFEDGLREGVFCRDARGDVARGVVWPGATVYPDFTSPRTREWWGQRYQSYVDQGVDGFWHDMNEPSAFAAFGDPTLPHSTRHDLDGRGGDHREAHNVYGLLMNRAGYAGLLQLRPGRRPFLVSRSGWAGMQRYAGTWSGDIGTSWDALRISLAMTIGLGACGVPYSGPDIGGFDSRPPTELYLRWFQLATFLPFFRTHSSAHVPAREPWVWGDDVLVRVTDDLRMRYVLLPYWYTLAWQVHRTGVPYVRPLLWADPSDPALRHLSDAFLLGDALLVAPVLDEGVREQRVRLPAGRWYDRRTGVAHDGPGEVTVPANLSDAETAGVPVLVRAGAVLPVAPDLDERIVLEAYPPGDEDPTGPGGMLITDSGDGWEEPVEERFGIARDASGELTVTYDGPAESLPYEVCWVGTSVTRSPRS